MAGKQEVKECSTCANWGTMNCPNSSECYALIDKPYWKARCKEPTLIDIIEFYLKHWQDENRTN